MKKMLTFGVTFIVLFGGAAAVSWTLRGGMASHGEEPADKESQAAPAVEHVGKSKAGGADGHGAEAGANQAAGTGRAAVRPPYTAGAEEAVVLASSLRDRLKNVREREEQLTARQKQLDLIYKDIRGERSAIDELRKMVNDEVKAVKQQMTDVERKRGDLDKSKQDVSDQVSQMKKDLIELDDVEKKNIDKMAKMYGGMDPESAARILQQMADTGKMDTVVKVLGQIQERQAAKILAALPETVAAQLLEKLKGLKHAPSSSTTSSK